MKNVLSTKPFLLKNTNINTVVFKFVYPIKKEYKHSNYLDILENIVATTTKEYKDRLEYKNKKLEYSIINLELSSTSIGDTRYLFYTITLPKDGLIEDYDFEESLKFCLKAIKEPNFEGEAVNEKEFIYEKDYFVTRLEDMLQNFNAYVGNIFQHIIDPNELMNSLYETDLEDLKNTTKEDLYKFYKENIIDNSYALYIFGNFEEDKMLELCDKYFKQDKDKIEYEYNYFNILPMATPKFTEKEIPFQQSMLLIEYQIDKYDPEEYVYMYMLTSILSGQECKLLFNELRLKNDLVYHVGTDSKSKNGFFEVYSYISNFNLDIVIEKIDNVINNLIKDEDYLNDCFKKILKSYEVDMIKEKDNESKEINDILDHDLKQDTLEEEYEKLKKITSKDMIKFINKIKKTNTIFLRGGSND